MTDRAVPMALAPKGPHADTLAAADDRTSCRFTPSS